MGEFALLSKCDALAGTEVVEHRPHEYWAVRTKKRETATVEGCDVSSAEFVVTTGQWNHVCRRLVQRSLRTHLNQHKIDSLLNLLFDEKLTHGFPIDYSVLVEFSLPVSSSCHLPGWVTQCVKSDLPDWVAQCGRCSALFQSFFEN